MKSTFLLASLCGLTACASADLLPPKTTVERGSVEPQSVKKVVVMPVRCADIGCSSTLLKALDASARSSLEFAGFSVIELDQVNAEAGKRVEIFEREQRSDQPAVEIRQTNRERVTLEDLPPYLQNEAVQALGANGKLSLRIFLPAKGSASLRQRIVAQARLVRIPDHQLVWTRRCAVEYATAFPEQAIQDALRCALGDQK